jgi:urease accessory protein
LSRATVSIRAERRPGGTAISSLSGTEPWHPRVLRPTAGRARVALVQSRASLVRADDVSLAVEVRPGAALEIVELGALIAHSVRDGATSSLRVAVEIAAGGCLIWPGQPLIVAAGAALESFVSVSLRHGARLLRGESVVLGRAGEDCGALRARFRVELEGRPLLDETLDTGDRLTLRSPVVSGSPDSDGTSPVMISALTLAGCRDPDPPEGVLQAHLPASLWRGCGDAVSLAEQRAALERRWRKLVLSPVRGQPARIADAVG